MNATTFIKPLLLGFALACFLSACVTTQRGFTGYDTTAKREFLRYAGSQSPVLLAVVNAPFAAGDRAVADAAARHAAGAIFGLDTRFTADEASARQPHFRIIMAFDAANTTLPDEICGAGPRPVAFVAPGGKIRLQSVFCARNEALSAVSGSGVAVASPDDPEFRRLIHSVMSELFPIDDFNRDAGEGILRIPG